MVTGVLVLQCARKLLTAVGGPTAGDPPDRHPLDRWHANLFHWERRKCVIFVNDRTLLPVLLFGVKKQQLSNLADLFTERFCSQLEERKVPAYVVDEIRRLYGRAHVTATSDRSVGGSLNQFTKELKWVVAQGRCRSPTLGTGEVDDFLWAEASVRIPEFRVAEALTDVFLARFVESGRPDLADARAELRRRSRLA